MRSRVAKLGVLVAAVAVAAAGVGVAAVANADTTAVHYVALGDSFASGQGAGTDIQDPDNCKRSLDGYPARWAAKHEPTSFQNNACAGATAKAVTEKQLSLLTAETTLVTVQAGGNDLDFFGTLLACFFGSDDECKKAIAAKEALISTTLASDVDALLAAIKDRAPNAEVVLVGYPLLFETSRDCVAGSFTKNEAGYFNAAVDKLDDELAERAAAAGYGFADPRTAFAGHGACGSEQWINDDLNKINDIVHPNADGYRLGYLPTIEASIGR